jgi:hypothetical protein
MYNIERHTRKFNTDDNADLSEYERILNDPLCTVIVERKEKITEKQGTSDGMMNQQEYVIMVVTWDEKVLAI